MHIFNNSNRTYDIMYMYNPGLSDYNSEFYSEISSPTVIRLSIQFGQKVTDFQIWDFQIELSECGWSSSPLLLMSRDFHKLIVVNIHTLPVAAVLCPRLLSVPPACMLLPHNSAGFSLKESAPPIVWTFLRGQTSVHRLGFSQANILHFLTTYFQKDVLN